MEPAVFWTMIAAIATAVSAVATMASAVVITVQAILTRKALDEAKRSADASERAAAVANESLVLAREQAHQSEVLTAEAIRSRMDAIAPRVFMTMIDTDRDGAKPVAYARSDHGDPRLLTQIYAGETFWSGRDDETWLYAIFRVKIENAGQHPVVISPGLAFNFLTNELFTDRVHQLHIAPGTAARPLIAVGSRVSGWIRVAQEPNRTKAVAADDGWSVIVEGETGVLVRQTFRIEGTILESGPEKTSYTLRKFGPDPMHNYSTKFVIDKQKREYVLGWDEIGNPRLLPTPEISKLSTFA